MNLKWVLAVTTVLFCQLLSAQDIDKYFQDIQWAHYNANINMFLGDGIGSAIKGGVDADYVDEKIGIQDFPFHSIEGMLIETFSVVDFNREANKGHYRLKFANEQSATFPEVIMYLADNYSNYYTAPDLVRPYLPDEFDKIRDSCNLKDSKRVILQEYWYYDIRDNTMKSFLRGMGIIDNAQEKNEQVVWVDMRYFNEEVLNRVNIVMENGSTQNFVEYMNNRPFVMEGIKWGYSRFFDQSKYDEYNTEINVYFELLMLENQIILDKPNLKMKKGKPVKSKYFTGLFKDEKFEGEWRFNYENGKIRGEFNFENGEAKGKYSLYDLKGNIKETGNLIGNKKVGENTIYFESGNKKGSKNYTDGKLHGSQILYFDNESKHSTFSYQNGYTHGRYNGYNFDGSEKIKGEFKNGVIVGEWNYNLPINSLMCGYLVDEIPAMGEITGLDPTCMEDCMATFKYIFEEKEDINCFNGVCILPKRLGDIK